MEESKLIISPLSQNFKDGDITVDVQIYRIEGDDGWRLELVDEKGNSTAWTDPFPTDEAAWQEFATSVQELGLMRLLRADDEEEVTFH